MEISYRFLFKLLAYSSLLVIIPTFFHFIALKIENSHKQFIKDREEYQDKKFKKDIYRIYKDERELYYKEALFNYDYLLKNSMLSKAQLIELCGIIDEKLGCFKEYYSKQKFESKSEEISTKMMSYYIDINGWKDIIAYLDSCYEFKNVLTFNKVKKQRQKAN